VAVAVVEQLEHFLSFHSQPTHCIHNVIAADIVAVVSRLSPSLGPWTRPSSSSTSSASSSGDVHIYSHSRGHYERAPQTHIERFSVIVKNKLSAYHNYTHYYIKRYYIVR